VPAYFLAVPPHSRRSSNQCNAAKAVGRE